MTKKIKTIHDLLEQYTDLIVNQRDKGTSFERLMKSYLQLDPLYQDQYKNVFMWGEWPHRASGQDHGIDLVAEGHDGGFTAIQCKFYSSSYQIQKGDIDSFFTESGKTFLVDGKRKSFSQRIIISTSDNWSAPAEKALDGQTIPVIRVHVRELEKSPIDWSKFSLEKPESLSLKDKKRLRPHQKEAIDKILNGYKEHDRGKLIMACGTGKTFTSLKLAENIAQNGEKILFLVPSISLLSQTLREWTAESETPFHAFSVCSDSKVGKHSEDISKHDLAIPASTDTASLLKGLEKVKNDNKMIVIFSTYQSIDVISKAQKKGLAEFDLIICDEAHRTTGATASDKEDSHFVKVHDQKFIQGKKRLYMTATPRIFGDSVKTKAGEVGAELYSMDDENLYGPEFHRLGFGKAVGDDLLTDYKVLVLAIDEGIIDPKFQKSFASENGEIPLEDIAKIIGCWNGLSKRLVGKEAVVEDGRPMKRAVAFTRTIKDSKQIVSLFENVVHEYIKKYPNIQNILNCELGHVDGTFNVLDRNAKLDWLKAESPENTCRILTNARCLSEGVDVPALDAVLFLNPRDSMVDVVQSVGRIMRKAEGKKYGYVILPIGIPAGVSPDEALKDNKKYRVVWQVLQALRAHDDRFDAEVNKIDLNKNRSNVIQVIGVGGGDSGDGSEEGAKERQPTQLALNLNEIEEWKDAIYAKIVLKCGTRPYWENWAADVAKIAERHTDQIKKILKSDDKKARKSFEIFLNGIRKNLNPSISEIDAIEMLSQQLVTKPVFDALFEHYKFTELNPVSQTMQSVLKVFEDAIRKEDAEILKAFYQSVRMRVKGINNAEARQRVIKELYDRFFNIAFKKMADRLGIVYTPIEVVDFIIRSVEDVMQGEFGKSLSDEGVHILDPFTGTGTFIVRLLQSGIIKKKDLERKFKNELHANELVLLAYYIASVNIEETYHDLMGDDYVPFEGAVLTDTFQHTEGDEQDLLEAALPKNHERAENQRENEISAIISNPPYSIGQKNESDNNQNVTYGILDQKIRETYAEESSATMKKGLYASEIRALRWATDRLGDEGVIGFVTNGSFIDSTATDGVRKSLLKNFSKMYIFNLRGNQRTKGEKSKEEGGKIFDSGSRSTVAITILVKKKEQKEKKVFYYDIGKYLTRNEKLKRIKEFETVKNIPWKSIVPNKYGDWINSRNEDYKKFIPMGLEKSKRSESIFNLYTLGVATNRDAWCVNFSRANLEKNIIRLLTFYKSEQERLNALTVKGGVKNVDISAFVSADKKDSSWTHNLKKSLQANKNISFKKESLRLVSYRPFVKSWMYFNRDLNERVFLCPKLFPNKECENLVIVITGRGESKDFSSLITSNLSELKLHYNSQCFPLYYYEEECKSHIPENNAKLPDYKKNDAISDFAHREFINAYDDKKIGKKDIFFYVYGLLHCPAYKKKYHNDLNKMLPRIPFVENFWDMSSDGKKLAELHIGYEQIEPYPLEEELNSKTPLPKDGLYCVNEKGMKFPVKKGIKDKTTILFNDDITLRGIPELSYKFVVDGRSAIEWIMERYKVTTDKASGIKNDPNEWSDDPRYIIDLVKRIVRVSLETNRIVSELPPFVLLDDNKNN
ncbi:MAG: damage-inducible protein [Bdellovibrionales bacterium CG12_big_fil_rev_8_21_14_0_65_38_15]|nr:MAG: damage-inducible protein [Bdellovibrionales bacterium CG22_combo_CG10-13_8_21_14_all_38_13]PIQ56006.1 MAG: damage-inducible protein [Bdellovibrionales bacterium CG12_big_fil_rev_8_21_14_0_65_38_15]